MLAVSAATNENFLISVLVQLAVIIGVARAFGILFQRFGQPAVVGEITAGVVLGPSVFGKLEILAGYANHPLSHAIFDPSVGPVIKLLSELGLILLLFIVGLEFDFSHLKTHHRSAISISLAGILIPFGLGYALAHVIQPHLEAVETGNGSAAPVELHGFALFMGTAMAITAMPVMGRMLLEFNVMRTRLAAVTISAAAVDDATGWIILAAVSAVVHADYNIISTLRMVGLTVGFAFVMAFIARPILIRWIRWAMARGQGDLGLNAIAVLLIIIMLCAIATSLIGIFAIFGAFILGAVLSDQRAFHHAVSRQLRNFVTVFFLPIFFTYTGLKTDIGTLTRPELWAFAAAVCAAAVAGKLGGCTLAARATGIPWRESLCIGSLMNTRGLMELIVINVGYELHVIPRSVFCMLVMMALLTNFMTTPLVLALKKGTEFEEPMRHSPLSRRKPAGPLPV